MQTSNPLANLRLLVTGAGKRVGKVIADDLESLGAKVFRHTRADGDLSVAADCAAVVAKAHERLGGLDGLVLSASIFRRTPFGSITAEDWDDFMNVNLRSVFLMSQAAAGIMKKGAIVVIGDGATARPSRHYLPYSVSKAALRPLVADLALELAPRIRVNMISSGPVLPPEGTDTETAERLAELQPLKKIGRPENLLPAIRDALTNDFMTGAEIRIDGGRGL
jgi:pteridine reductase